MKEFRPILIKKVVQEIVLLLIMNNLISKFFSKQDWILGMKFSPSWYTTLKVPQTSTSTKKSWKLCSGKRQPRCWLPLEVIRSQQSPRHFLYAKPQTRRQRPLQVLVPSLSLPNVNHNQLLQQPPVQPQRSQQVTHELKQSNVYGKCFKMTCWKMSLSWVFLAYIPFCCF